MSKVWAMDVAEGAVEDAAEDVVEAAVRRWRAIDPLVSAAELPVEGRIVVDDGAAVFGRDQPKPGTTDSLWGALDQLRLRARVAGPDPAGSLTELIARWRDRLAALPEPPGPDSAAVLSWPSRDTEITRVLLAHGFQPRTITAVRPAGRPAVDVGGTGAVIRTATPDDVDAGTGLWREVNAYDGQTGSVVDRRDCDDAIRAAVAEAIGRDRVWIAELDGRPVGLAWVAIPPESDWVAPMVAAAPVAYFAVMSVTATHRGAGTGAALAAHAHRHLDDTGITATVLHHSLANPRSTPFWNRQGYRPLWTTWEIRPATAMLRR